MFIDDDPCHPDDSDYAFCICSEIYEVGSSEWHACIADIYFEEPDFEVPDISNSELSCNCDTPENERVPAGCVTYTDSQFGNNQPVKNVTVRGITQLGIPFSVRTSDQGCWQAPRRLLRWDELDLEIRFNNEKTAIRSLWMRRFIVDFINPLDYINIVTDDLSIASNTIINNITINYEDNANPLSIFDDKLYFLACQTINSMEEYHEYADQYGIQKPQTDGLLSDDVDVLLTNLDGLSGAAPMIDEMGSGLFNNFNQENAHQAIIEAIMGLNLVENFVVDNLNIPEFTIGNFQIDVDGDGQWAENAITNLLNIVGDIAGVYSFDVALNYGGNANTDIVKYVLYHEFGHVGFYEKLPAAQRNDFWIANIDYIATNVQTDMNGGVGNQPYGTRGFQGAERTAINESWADHVGRLFSNLRYDEEHSNGVFSGLDLTHLNVLERSIPDENDTSNDFLWMGEGLFWDLMDNSNVNERNTPFFTPPMPVVDEVSGFTMSQIEELITTGAPENFNILRNRFINENPSSNTIEDLELLLDIYGY
jgi:hypothetical protein